jgi:hypothetical protein
MTLTAGLTTNSAEKSAVARHPHVTVSQRVWGLLRLCLFIICICASVHSDSHCSSCRSHYKIIQRTECVKSEPKLHNMHGKHNTQVVAGNLAWLPTSTPTSTPPPHHPHLHTTPTTPPPLHRPRPCEGVLHWASVCVDRIQLSQTSLPTSLLS